MPLGPEVLQKRYKLYAGGAKSCMGAQIRLLTKATGLDPLNPVYHRELAEALEEQLGATPSRSQKEEAPQKREPPHEQPQDRTRAGRSSKVWTSVMRLLDSSVRGSVPAKLLSQSVQLWHMLVRLPVKENTRACLASACSGLRTQ